MRILITIVLENGEIDAATATVGQDETAESVVRRSIKAMAGSIKVVSASASVFPADTVKLKMFEG